MKTYSHSGATGDMVFSLPTIREMGGGKLYITNFHKQRAESIKKLIEVQEYITEVMICDGKPDGCIDLDKFRNHASHHVNLVEAHFTGQGLRVDKAKWKDGWLTLPNEITKGNYSVINRTTNYEDWGFNWKNEYEHLKSISEKVFFIGYEEEYELFKSTFQVDDIEFYPCDFLDGAYFIAGAKMFTGCYSCWSTIAMGLGLEYRLVQAPNHTCSSLLESRETIINV
jgi:hypothetical protein